MRDAIIDILRGNAGDSAYGITMELGRMGIHVSLKEVKDELSAMIERGVVARTVGRLGGKDRWSLKEAA